MLSNFTFWRRLRGGRWFFNRYWGDSGRTVVFIWERNKLSEDGGSAATIKKEDHGDGLNLFKRKEDPSETNKL